MSRPSVSSRGHCRLAFPEWVAHLAMLTLGVFVLLAVGQPIYTDDLWWHLALGDAYLAEGPWLSQDPILYASTGPPLPASWLADAGLAMVAQAAGVFGLRGLHVLLVLGILGLAWSLFARAAQSRVVASIGTGMFAILAAYRLFQLRPHLGTLLAVLILYRLLMEDGASRSRWKLVAAGVLLVLWSNVHAGFLLGLILPGIALASVLVALPLRPAELRSDDLQRARYFALGLGVGLLGSLINPSVALPHMAYFTAGISSPELTRVGDEWARFTLLEWPRPNLPPSPISWAISWVLLIATPCIAMWGIVRKRGKGAEGSKPSVDPVLVGLSAASLIASLWAVRFLWMEIFPLLLVAQWLRVSGWIDVRATSSRLRLWALAALAVLLVLGFLRLGSWPMISRGIPRSWQAYQFPYPADKYFSHAIWFMQDAGLEGNLFNNYTSGSFASYWLPPKLKLFVNGSLNVSRETMDAGSHLRLRRGTGPEEGFLELLDRQGVDVFFGARLPQVAIENRPTVYTTGHLERSPGWIPIFRNMRSGVYLRDSERNRSNLETVSRYYDSIKVPFDPETGFDAATVIRERPGWAAGHGLVPVYFAELARGINSQDSDLRQRSLNRLSSVYGVLGLYDEAIKIDRRLLRSNASLLGPRRRLVWSLIRTDRPDEALESARELAQLHENDGLALMLADAAERYAAETDPDARATLRANLPILLIGEARLLNTGIVSAPARAIGGRNAVSSKLVPAAGS